MTISAKKRKEKLKERTREQKLKKNKSNGDIVSKTVFRFFVVRMQCRSHRFISYIRWRHLVSTCLRKDISVRRI